MAELIMLPCLDDPEMAEYCRRALQIPRERAAALGQSAVQATDLGYYEKQAGERVDWQAQVHHAVNSKQSFPRDHVLPALGPPINDETRVQVCNRTTLDAAKRLVELGHRPLALNFANGVSPGGGFLNGALAQEEVLCRSSALFRTLDGDPMYAVHRARTLPDSTDWVIYSPDVPVFRSDGGAELEKPWLLSFASCAAPYAPKVGQPASGDLLQNRIRRVLLLACTLGYETLVLGAWGCGAFRNDPHRTASDFRSALQQEFAGHFSEVLFAIADWSPDRHFLGPFRDAFS